MKYSHKISTLFTALSIFAIILSLTSCPGGVDPFPYSFNCSFKVIDTPSGSNPENLALVLQLSAAEGEETELSVSDFRVFRNGALIYQQNNFSRTIAYNAWINDKGVRESNYQTLFYCLPSGYSGSIDIDDEIKIILECTSNRVIENSVVKHLIDNSPQVSYWKKIGEEIFTIPYPQEPVPDETIVYNEKTYRLVFNEDFNTDYSDMNPLKNGKYRQAMNLHNWFAEDWGDYVNSSNGLEHRSIKNFRINNGIAEFPMVHEENKNSGPSLVTSIWDSKGESSIPLYSFNKGIFEIRFMGPDDSRLKKEDRKHPGQFTFWVLNYNTNFEAGRFPTNPKKASDGYALDEIDFFEYSPYNNTIRTGSRSCNGVNSRPAAGYRQIDLGDDFGGQWHVFRCVWDDSGLTSYLDGTWISSVPASSIKGFDNSNDSFMLLISSQSIKESGIDGPDNLIYSDFEPYSFYVDYIKVYEQN